MSSLVDEQGKVICHKLAVARSARTRMKGLLGRRSLEPDEGLLLRPAGSVHTAFMHFPIDVVFLDRSMRVLRIAPKLRPWRIVGQRGARIVVELDAGAAERNGISPGARLRLEDGAAA